MKAAVQRLVWPAYLVLAVAASISVLRAVQSALSRSQDFQWSGAHMLAHGIDPYGDYLAGDPRHAILMSQIPNYLHEYYVALWPVGLLSFGHAKVLWVIANLAFTVGIVALLRSVYRLNAAQTYLLAVLLAMSTSFRVAVASGQQALLETLLLCIALWKPSNSGIALGASYFKYSFSPIVFFYAAARREWRQLAISIAVVMIGMLFFWARVHGSFLDVLVEPLLVSRRGMERRADGDLISLTNIVFPRLYNLGMAVALALSALLAVLVSHWRRTIVGAAAALAAADLALLPHGTHDAVLLSVPLAWLLSRARWSPAILASCFSIFIFWYGFKFIPLSQYPATYQMLHIGLLAVLFLSVLSIPEIEGMVAELSAPLQETPGRTSAC
jgi:hypothetical protein